MKRIVLALMLVFALIAVPASSAENMPLDVSVRGCYLMPLGDMGDMFNYGYGAVAGISAGKMGDMLINGLDLGFEIGYLTFSGKDENVDGMYMIPALLTAGYKLDLNSSISISPRLSLGYSYNCATYDAYHYDSIVGKETLESTSESAFEPLASVGIVVSYSLMDKYNLHVGAEYNSIFESDGNMGFLSFSAGMGMRL